MRVLGIDPGIAVTGYGIVEEKERTLVLIGLGTINTTSQTHFSQRLGKLFQRVGELIKDYHPEALAAEEPFLAKNARMALNIGQARGAAILAGVNAGLEVASYTPLQVKLAVVGYGRAEKEQVQEMVKRLLNLEEIPRPDHAADAIGLAICHLHT
ncbi:MAG: crossover junction endodeoxyribonuclease RuvC, partial [Nitrospirae bacterium]|nr:crossover junction endodeoxyribonuclease RuvC [Nitrospirota bacterium]